MTEFSLIDQFFKSIPLRRNDVVYGIGDDAACLQIPEGQQLLVSTDTLVSGIHFLPEWGAYDIACKAVMSNVSDMAAMAATPCWITLALTLPELNSRWLEDFSRGLQDSLEQFDVDLIGGDTTHGPLSITITIMGLAPAKQSVRRQGAKAGDIIMVSGPLGAAALAVKFLETKEARGDDDLALMNKLLHPMPRVDLTPVLRKYASAAIDISDGLSADLNHICVASKVGACIDWHAIPIHPLLVKYLGTQAVDLALSGGDDYEICFTVAEAQLDSLFLDLKKLHCMCYPIGVIEDTLGMRIKTVRGDLQELSPKGYSHF